MSKVKLLNYSNKLPTLKEWTKHFRYRNSIAPRVTVGSLEAAEKGFKALNLKKVENMTAVEINPGLGAWTTALRNNGFKRIIALEPQNAYLNWMEGLSALSDGKIEVVKKDGYTWDTYNCLKDDTKYIGSLENKDWSQVHSELFFTGTLPKTTNGERLLAQFTGCITNKMAMHTLGRIQMAFWMTDVLYKKLAAPPGSNGRCKMSVVAEACAEVKSIYVPEVEEMYPNGEYRLVHIIPTAETEWDTFEYVLKHLFVMQRHPLRRVIR
ncbi:ribosomal RNA adenine methyltransferase KsgA/Erm [Mycotypha africana]|uniref:ribosomal RNA adenine methyltransferase KsgA/Erm n=1 Tax=Mycotypha africana TaxID=64632 RepID=UPI002301E5CE|nr:ribosomal RNA adenine methyltransferase KsgA/Erm [Mycotypha africana]KAI8990942.1 ribosomal RNA adenine methyltransferase KsgA/Erm [Mycotypha africana]